MSDDRETDMIDSTSDAAERSLVDDVRALIDDGRTLVEAEVAYQKSRAAVAGAGVRGVATWGGLALVFVFFALMAVVFGAVLGLAALVGPWAATAIVVVVLAGLAAVCLLVAAQRWRHAARLLSDQDEPE